MDRILVPELLDTLAPEDSAAQRSRRDLRIINRLMGNERWLEFTVVRLARVHELVLEVGAGEGCLARRLRSDALDLRPRPHYWPRWARWHQGDARQFSGWSGYAVVVGSLVFHHFNAEELAALGERIRRSARVFIVTEPARGPGWLLVFAALCPLIRAGDVTRHDGRASIDAGFAADELPRLMGFASPTWHCAVRRTWRGAYRFIALRS